MRFEGLYLGLVPAAANKRGSVQAGTGNDIDEICRFRKIYKTRINAMWFKY